MPALIAVVAEQAPAGWMNDGRTRRMLKQPNHTSRVRIASRSLCVFYLLLSGTCLGVSALDEAVAVLNTTYAYLWLLGPPALLLHQFKLTEFYLLATGTIGAIVYGVARSGRRYSAWVVLLPIIGAIVWCAFGLLFYLPLV